MRIPLLRAVAITVLALPASARGQGLPAGDSIPFHLDFNEAPLASVIASIAEAGGLNIVLSSLPEQRLTIRTTMARLPFCPQ